MCIQNLKTLALIEAKTFVTENLLGEKEKWTNNGNDKQQYAASLLHSTTSHIQHLYQISNLYSHTSLLIINNVCQQYVYVCIYGNGMYLLLQWWIQVLTCIIILDY